MLDTPVPNPVAKNPNFYTHKVFAATGLILIGTILSLSVIWYFFFSNSPIKNGSTSTQTQVGTSSAKNNKYSGWNEFQNLDVGFTLNYPKDWLISSYKDSELCNPDHTFLSPTKEALGICSSGVGGIVSITRTPAGTKIDSVYADFAEHNFTNRVNKDLKVGGKMAKKISGTSNLVSLTDDFTGHRFIVYLVDLGEQILIVQYNQPPDYKDYSEEFEDIVTSLKFK